MYERKRPELVVSATFEFHRFSRKAQLSIAQSLFTHLTPGDIRLCLGNLRIAVDPGHRFFASFLEGDSSSNPGRSLSQAGFWYSRAELEHFGERTGWTPRYLGEWGHPRGQMMMRYETR